MATFQVVKSGWQSWHTAFSTVKSRPDLPPFQVVWNHLDRMSHCCPVSNICLFHGPGSVGTAKQCGRLVMLCQAYIWGCLVALAVCCVEDQHGRRSSPRAALVHRCCIDKHCLSMLQATLCWRLLHSSIVFHLKVWIRSYVYFNWRILLWVCMQSKGQRESPTKQITTHEGMHALDSCSGASLRQLVIMQILFKAKYMIVTHE